MARFGKMLDDPRAHVFVVWGPGGVGKSSLQAKMWHEVATRGLIKSEVIWTETRNHDMMAITRKIRDDIGPLSFGTFTELMNLHRAAARAEAHDRGPARRSRWRRGRASWTARAGDIAGIMVKDIMLPAPLRDMQTSESERHPADRRVHRRRRGGAERAPAVIFFDATEKMTAETEKWVWSELIPAACEGRMGNAKFVLCGRAQPQIDRMLAAAIGSRSSSRCRATMSMPTCSAAASRKGTAPRSPRCCSC